MTAGEPRGAPPSRLTHRAVHGQTPPLRARAPCPRGPPASPKHRTPRSQGSCGPGTTHPDGWQVREGERRRVQTSPPLPLRRNRTRRANPRSRPHSCLPPPSAERGCHAPWPNRESAALSQSRTRTRSDSNAGTPRTCPRRPAAPDPSVMKPAPAVWEGGRRPTRKTSVGFVIPALGPQSVS